MTLSNNLSTTQPIELIYPDNAPEAFHLLAKPTGAICNLDCAYCFFLEKEHLGHRHSGPHWRSDCHCGRVSDAVNKEKSGPVLKLGHSIHP